MPHAAGRWFGFQCRFHAERVRRRGRLRVHPAGRGSPRPDAGEGAAPGKLTATATLQVGKCDRRRYTRSERQARRNVPPDRSKAAVPPLRRGALLEDAVICQPLFQSGLFSPSSRFHRDITGRRRFRAIDCGLAAPRKTQRICRSHIADHRLFCGSALEPASFIKLMAGETAVMVEVAAATPRG
jgi:hypothetical protein